MIKVFECHYSFGYFIGTILAIPFFIVLTISFKNIKGDNKNRMNYALKKIILIDLSVILCLLQLLIITQCHLDKVFYDENSISYAVMH